MFRAMKKFGINNGLTIFEKTVKCSVVLGSGFGLYNGYKDTRHCPYDECLMITTGSTLFGAVSGLWVGLSLPITLPVAISVTFFRLVDAKITPNRNVT